MYTAQNLLSVGRSALGKSRTVLVPGPSLKVEQTVECGSTGHRVVNKLCLAPQLVGACIPLSERTAVGVFDQWRMPRVEKLGRSESCPHRWRSCAEGCSWCWLTLRVFFLVARLEEGRSFSKENLPLSLTAFVSATE